MALFFSPIIGMLTGYLIVKLSLFFARGATPHVNIWFKRGQLITAATLAMSHGSNDAQKTMGIITFGLVAFGVLPVFIVPTWVIGASATAIALGTALGGWRLIKTMGAGFYRIRAAHAFSSQVASSAVILSAALLGGPVSTTQVISSSIVGAGAAERLNMVRWGLAGQIAMAWLITIPATALLGGIFFILLDKIM